MQAGLITLDVLVWGADQPSAGWIANRPANCLVHLMRCKLQPSDVRERAKCEHLGEEESPSRGGQASGDLVYPGVHAAPPITYQPVVGTNNSSALHITESSHAAHIAAYQLPSPSDTFLLGFNNTVHAPYDAALYVQNYFPTANVGTAQLRPAPLSSEFPHTNLYGESSQGIFHPSVPNVPGFTWRHQQTVVSHAPPIDDPEDEVSQIAMWL